MALLSHKDNAALDARSSYKPIKPVSERQISFEFSHKKVPRFHIGADNRAFLYNTAVAAKMSEGIWEQEEAEGEIWEHMENVLNV